MLVPPYLSDLALKAYWYNMSNLIHNMDEHPTAEEPNSTTSTNQLSLPYLIGGCEQIGVPLSGRQIAQFEIYFQELVDWNKKMNLTAITERSDVQVKHFLDSIVGLPLIVEELEESLPMQQSHHIVDVGTGAGFPGIPLKIMAPNLKLTLMDGTGKKIRFLNNLVQKLEIDRVSVLQGRAEELGHNTAYRGQFDLVAARAVASLNTLVEYLLPLTRRGGYAIIYKGGNAAQEFIEARRAIEVLGGETKRFAPITVPFLEQNRSILIIEKVQRTPNQYPRGQGLARKNPLA